MSDFVTPRNGTVSSLDTCPRCCWISANVNNPRYLALLRADQRTKRCCPNCGWSVTS